MPKFLDDVLTIEDVKPGMQIEGVVTNVAAFGAFVDIGVHQDGLVHVSQLSDRFVRDPAEVVKVGQKLKVTVLEVDVPRKRISLSARSNPQIGPRPPRGDRGPGGYGRGGFNREVDRDGGQVWRSGPSGFGSNPFSGL